MMMDVKTVRVHADGSAFSQAGGVTSNNTTTTTTSTTTTTTNSTLSSTNTTFPGPCALQAIESSANRIPSISTNSCAVSSHPCGSETGTGASQPINFVAHIQQTEDISGGELSNTASARQQDLVKSTTSYFSSSSTVIENLTSNNTHNNNNNIDNTPLPYDGFPAANDSDLVWVPEWSSYVERASRRGRQDLIEGNPIPRQHNPTALPHNFPAQISDASVWDGNILAKQPESWIIEVNESEVEEIESAVKQILDSNTALSDITRDNFPLPTLGPKLDVLGKSLYKDGLGFFILRGLNPKKYSAAENITGYVGVSSWVGDERGVQDEHGNMLLHLKDLGNNSAPANVRQAPYSNVEQPYHTDSAEIIALYVLSPAAQGGRSKLASSGQIYNHLTTDEIRTLSSEEFVFDRFNDKNEIPPPRPLIFAPAEPHSPHPTLAFSRRPLTGSTVSPRSPHLPKLSTKQLDTLDTLQFLADKFCLKAQLQAGDVLYWNNYKIVHAREGFEAAEQTKATSEPYNGRHYVRLWLRKAGGGLSGGVQDLVRVLGPYQEPGDAPRVEQWPIDPIIDWKHITTRSRSSGHA